MDQTEQNLIDDLFSKLAAAERDSGPRDRDAEQYIQRLTDRQPGAPYYMAQALIVQEHALKNAQDRIAELEARLAESRPASSGGGSFLGGLLGSKSSSVPPAGSRYPAQTPSGYPPQPPSSIRGPEEGPIPQYQRGGGGGGFLAGAMQTAAGVAGGVMLGNLLTGMFSGGHHGAQAHTATPGTEAKPEAAHKDDDNKQEAAADHKDDSSDQDAHVQDASYNDDDYYDDDFSGDFDGGDSFDI